MGGVSWKEILVLSWLKSMPAFAARRNGSRAPNGDPVMDLQARAPETAKGATGNPMSQTLTITPLGPTIGAVAEGVDLRQVLPDATIARLREALLDHKVLFFEDQDLTPAQHRDFAARFGELHLHPLYPVEASAPELMVLDNHIANPSDNDQWHTDVTFLERPAMGALLHAVIVPPAGGDTLWSSMTAAYAALSAPIRALLEGLTAVHDFTKGFPPEGLVGANAGRERYEKARIEHPLVVHPVVRTHPETGEPSLFVNSVFTTRIEGLNREESNTLLAMLFRHIQKPEFCVRWRWRKGAMAFWDNRCTQHYAVSDYMPHRRVMRRATIHGERPFFRKTETVEKRLAVAS
jgi:taurine dioxygenase